MVPRLLIELLAAALALWFVYCFVMNVIVPLVRVYREVHPKNPTINETKKKPADSLERTYEAWKEPR